MKRIAFAVGYGRITTADGDVLEGRLRWGGDEEAFWSDTFDGVKADNPWAVHVPPERLVVSYPIEVFGLHLTRGERHIELTRPFMARFGDIALIESRALDILVTLKSGAVFEIDRFAADDLADGVRVWDAEGGVVDVDEGGIRTIEFLPTAGLDDVPDRLHGTVSTGQGEFEGFIRWDWEKSVGTGMLNGRTADGELDIRFDTIRSIARDSDDLTLVTLVDGRELSLSGTRDVGPRNRGIGVEDRRFGRALITWHAFQRIDFSPGSSGPAYDDFPPGRPLTGTVTTHDGRHLTGRLVYDLDESETTETLDSGSQGVSFSIPFGLIATIIPPRDETSEDDHTRVILHGGHEFNFEAAGDLGPGNPGMLIFIEGQETAEHVPWDGVERVELDGWGAEG